MADKNNAENVGGVALGLKLDDSNLFADVKSAADKVKAQFTREFQQIGADTDKKFKQSFSGISSYSKSAADKVKTQFASSAKTAGAEVEKSMKSSFREVSSAGGSMADSLTGGIKKIGAAVVAAFSVQKIKEFGQSAIEQAASVQAQESQLSQTFGSLETTARSAMQDVADVSGILSTRLQGVGTQIYAFAKTSGMDSVNALRLMKDALQVTADSAAYYDRSLEDTAQSLQSFLKGNYANDAALGVSATETTRNAAANKLYGQSFKDLSEAQKQLTLLQMVKDANALSSAMGQAARESDGWENVIGNLRESWNQLLAAVGKPILQGAIAVVKRLTEWISNLATYAKAASDALGELFGWGSDETDNTATTAANTAQTASAISESVDNQNALTKAVEKTNTEVRRGIAGFDKLNLISKSTANSAADNADKIDSLNTISIPQLSTDETDGKIDTISQKIKELKEQIQNFIKPIVEFYNEYIKPIVEVVEGFLKRIVAATKEWFESTDWEPLKKALGEFFRAVRDFVIEVTPQLEWLYNNVLLPIGTLLVEKVLPPIVELLGGILNFITPIISALVNGFKPLWEDVLKPALDRIAEVLDVIVVKIKPKLEELGKEIGDALKEWEPLLKDLYEILGPILEMLITFLGGALGGALEAGLNSIKIIVQGIAGIAKMIKGLFAGDWDEVAQGAESMKNGVNEAIVAPFKHIWSGLSGGYQSLANHYDFSEVGGASASFGSNVSVGEISEMAQKMSVRKMAIGGIVKAPTLAVVGDNAGAGSGNPEVISPLNQLKQLMGGDNAKILEVLNRIYEMLYLSRNQGQQQEISAEIDGNTLFKAMVRQNEIYKDTHRGRSAFA